MTDTDDTQPAAGAPAPEGHPVTDGLLVKICGITSEADALLAVGLGADAVGFVLAPSPRQITPAVAGDIVESDLVRSPRTRAAERSSVTALGKKEVRAKTN